jgi:hypothetical protein
LAAVMAAVAVPEIKALDQAVQAVQAVIPEL